MQATLSSDEVQERWDALESRLLSMMHPEVADPVAGGNGGALVSIFEEHGAHGAEFYRCLERARIAAGGRRVMALGYEQAADGRVAPIGGFAVDGDDSEACVAAGWEHGWAINGLGFVFCDETACWAVMTLVDAQVTVCELDLLPTFFGSWVEAKKAQERFREQFDRDGILPSFRAMAGYSRLPG